MASHALRSRPDRIFVSVDESTSRSTISFAPPNAGDPIIYENDRAGETAMREASTLSKSYPGCTVHGPHFHAARPVGRKRPGRKPSAESGGGGGGGSTGGDADGGED